MKLTDIYDTITHVERPVQLSDVMIMLLEQ